MKATNMEIAKAALCSEGAVRKARERLDLDDLGVVLGWVLGQRVKELGLGAVDGIAPQKERVIQYAPADAKVFPKMVTMGNVSSVVEDLGYEPCDESGYAAGDFN
jgi:hypothetical protein